MDDLTDIFNQLKDLMKPYSPPFTVRADAEREFNLGSERDLMIEGRQRKGVDFASLVIRSDYVGFYYMPIYARPELKQVFKPELVKLLKGKSCFHIKTLTPELIEQIQVALKTGYNFYVEHEWV